jgi:uncharacterized protein YjbJ (UPF0337 family)
MDDFNKDRVEGTADKLKGNLKEAAGDATDDRDLQNEGKADQAEGSVRDTVGKAKESAKDLLDKAKNR